MQGEWELLENAHQLPPPTSIRINPKKKNIKFENAENIPWTQYGKYLKERPAFTYDPLFHAGTYYVQEASSMFLEYAIKQIIDLNQKQCVLDLCAAPGGKSTHIASLISEDSLLISNEIIASRATILNENICKWGYDNTWISNSDPVYFKNVPNTFDLMLVDAPCSGSGLFRKIPSYAQEFNIDLVTHCAQRQKRILMDSWDALAKNGYLIYMTCSMSEAENEEILDFIVSELNAISCKIELPSSFNIIETESPIFKAFGYRLSPHLVKGEGFFLAVLQKTSGDVIKSFEPKIKNQHLSSYYKQFTSRENKIEIKENENLFMMNREHLAMYEFLRTKIKLIKKGIHVGRYTPKEIVPSHEIALYEGVDNYKNIFEVENEIAISYLKRENIHIDLQEKGWFLISFQGVFIGWVKNIGKRINNYYPVNYRILSSKNLLSD